MNTKLSLLEAARAMIRAIVVREPKPICGITHESKWHWLDAPYAIRLPYLRLAHTCPFGVGDKPLWEYGRDEVRHSTTDLESHKFILDVGSATCVLLYVGRCKECDTVFVAEASP